VCVCVCDGNITGIELSDEEHSLLTNV